MLIYRAGQFSGDALDLCLRGIWFESWPGYPLSFYVFMVVFQSSKNAMINNHVSLRIRTSEVCGL
jgi:hypothetical protein